MTVRDDNQRAEEPVKTRGAVCALYESWKEVADRIRSPDPTLQGFFRVARA